MNIGCPLVRLFNFQHHFKCVWELGLGGEKQVSEIKPYSDILNDQGAFESSNKHEPMGLPYECLLIEVVFFSGR